MTTPTPGNTTVAAAASSGGSWYDPSNLAHDANGALNIVTDGLSGKLENLHTTFTDTTSAIETVSGKVVDGATWMATPGNWLRIVYVLVGGVILVTTAYVAFKGTAAGQATGRVVGAVGTGAALAAAPELEAGKAVAGAAPKSNVTPIRGKAASK